MKRKKQRIVEYEDSVTYTFGVMEFGGKLKMTGTRLWMTPNHGATDELRFNALPAGSYYPSQYPYFRGQYLESVFLME